METILYMLLPFAFGFVVGWLVCVAALDAEAPDRDPSVKRPSP
jgi:hypothetical protein